jgi:hypothetical protein
MDSPNDRRSKCATRPRSSTDDPQFPSGSGPFLRCFRAPILRRRLVVGILGTVILPVLMVGLLGCAGFTGASKPSATSSPASSLRIVTNTLPVGATQNQYKTVLGAMGGMGPYSWTNIGGQLPPGIALNPATGIIAGVPTQAGTFSFTTKVTDSKANSTFSYFSLNISSAPAPTITTLSPANGPMEGGSFVTISGGNFRPAAMIQFGSSAAQSVRVVDSAEIQVVTPTEARGTVNVTLQDSDGQVVISPIPFTFTEPLPSTPTGQTAPADVTVDASQTVSETGGDDLKAAKNIYSSASAPESNGGLDDWDLISSELMMKRMRNINGLGDCAVDDSGRLTGCSRLNSDLSTMRSRNLTPHVIVGQLAPSSIKGNPLQWGDAQWAQYDALCYAIVNYVVNQYAGTGFSSALFEVENELDTTMNAQDLWLTPTPRVPQGDPSRFTQFDTVYVHWAKAVSLVARQNPAKQVRIAAPSTGFWTVYYGAGQLWHNQIIQKYAAQGIRLDVVSLHIYGREAADLAKYAQSIRETLIASGNAKAEIWVTEWGPSDSGDRYFGGINASHQGAAWAIYFLLQALKGTVTGGSFLEVRDNQGTDMAGAKSDMYSAAWNHVEENGEYPKAVTNALSMVERMTGARKSASVSIAKPNLRALASSDGASASLIVTNYDYLFDYKNKNYSDLTVNETVTVAFKNLAFNGSVTVDRYVVDAQTSNLNYWVATGKLPPSVKSTQLQKVESFSASSVNGALTLPPRQLGPSAVSLWVVHQ